MQIDTLLNYLEDWAPLRYQEPYDNSGLMVGNRQAETAAALVCLDITEAVVEEAIDKNCGLIIAHHPLLFNGLKSITGKNAVERCVALAIKNDIALYALHTNLDNVAQGVNRRIGEKLGLEDMRVLAPKVGLLKKIVVFVPENETEKLRQAMFSAGAGTIGHYDECSFLLKGKGTFRGKPESNPTLGEKGIRHQEKESRLEFIVEEHKQAAVVKAMLEAHPYEEVAYDLYALENNHQNIGSGMIGAYREPRYTLDFLQEIKTVFGGMLRHTAIVKDEIRTIAWCGGSGSFLLPQAKAAGADLFLSSDFKYHQFFEAEQQIIIADIGHYENEQFTKELIADALREKFSNFATLLTENNTNPINYL